MDLCAPWSHGCRVMDAQTYGDPEIVEALNRDYVPIRIDSDRRPATHDPMYGGFGKAPKFPLVPSLRVALQALHETQGPDFRMILSKTLDAMADRGLYDHEQGGFFHYVTNDTWTMARFEKLAEDNAALIRLYLDAAVVMSQDKYLAKALHAVDWAKSTLLDPERGASFGS